MTPHKRSSALNGKTPQIKFAQDDAIRVTFLFDDVKQSIHEKYGASYNYTVSSQHTDGTVNDRAFMRCTEILHNRIIDAGAGKGAVIDIMKIQLPENKSGWDVALVTPCSSPGLALKDWDGNLLESLGSGKDMFSPGGTTPFRLLPQASPSMLSRSTMVLISLRPASICQRVSGREYVLWVIGTTEVWVLM